MKTGHVVLFTLKITFQHAFPEKLIRLVDVYVEVLNDLSTIIQYQLIRVCVQNKL